MAATLTLTCALLGMAGAAQATTRSVGWLHTSGSRILTSSNRPHTIKAVNWFGMETSDCAPHGLWQIRLDDGLAQIASLGFNTIRLPYSNECLHASHATSINSSKNPQLAHKTPLKIMDIVVQRAEAHGLSIILDRHRPGVAGQSELWYSARYPEHVWIADWRMLARRYAKRPTVIGMDLAQ
jgi:endoglucanase